MEVAISGDGGAGGGTEGRAVSAQLSQEGQQQPSQQPPPGVQPLPQPTMAEVLRRGEAVAAAATKLDSSTLRAMGAAGHGSAFGATESYLAGGRVRVADDQLAAAVAPMLQLALAHRPFTPPVKVAMAIRGGSSSAMSTLLRAAAATAADVPPTRPAAAGGAAPPGPPTGAVAAAAAHDAAYLWDIPPHTEEELQALGDLTWKAGCAP